MRTLLTADQIAHRVAELGRRLTTEYAGKDLLIVGVLHGSVVLVADLIRQINLPHQIAFVRASSYGAGTKAGELTLNLEGLPALAGRHVILVDDIFDTGKTMARLSAEITLQQPASLKSAVLLWKTARREVEQMPDYFAFVIPDEFVVGYGLDFNGHYRHLPYIAVLEPADLP